MTDSLINFCYHMPQLKLSNRDRLNPHGKTIVDLLLSDETPTYDSLGEFIKLWRVNFISGMEPKYLPSGWRVEHTIERSFGAHSKFNKENQSNEEAKSEDN